MCTAVSFTNGRHCFGRTLDLEYSLQEAVVTVPRHYPIPFRRAGTAKAHYAMIGIATEADGYPLFYDAMNERGLCMAALHFPGNAVYRAEAEASDNIAPFEMIPWILSQCASVRQAHERLSRLNVCRIPFSEAYPLTPLHWMIADGASCAVMEATADGLHVYENPVGVLTNNPPFPVQLMRLYDYRHLSSGLPPPSFQPGVPMEAYSRGMGAIGLPGDYSSPSRFVRAAFARSHMVPAASVVQQIGEFFHMMDTVQVPRGSVRTERGECVVTQYTSCYTPGRCSVTTYADRSIRTVWLSGQDTEGNRLSHFPLSRRTELLTLPKD